MALTFRTLLNRLAEMEGKSFDVYTSDQLKVRVAHLNAALRWAWKTDQPKFAFPFTVTSATVTVTSGKIDPDDLGEGTWGSFFTADPRPAGATACQVNVQVADDGVYPIDATTTVFAFYRFATPQGTYAEGGEYATPSNIPAQVLDMVAVKALSTLFVSMQQWDAVNALKASYEDPKEQKEALMAALLNSGMSWQRNGVAMSLASTPGVVPGSVAAAPTWRYATGGSVPSAGFFTADNDEPNTLTQINIDADPKGQTAANNGFVPVFLGSVGQRLVVIGITNQVSIFKVTAATDQTDYVTLDLELVATTSNTLSGDFQITLWPASSLDP